MKMLFSETQQPIKDRDLSTTIYCTRFFFESYGGIDDSKVLQYFIPVAGFTPLQEKT